MQSFEKLIEKVDEDFIASGVALAMTVPWMKEREKEGGAAAPFSPPSCGVGCHCERSEAISFFLPDTNEIFYSCLKKCLYKWRSPPLAAWVARAQPEAISKHPHANINSNPALLEIIDSQGFTQMAMRQIAFL
jgi:hypothetical protein